MGKTEGYSVKREIKDAVMELMAEKPYMDITVNGYRHPRQGGAGVLLPEFQFDQ